MSDTRTGPWVSFLACVECGAYLTDDQKTHSGGICPYCGHDDRSTICATRNEVCRKVFATPCSWKAKILWFFGVRPYEWEEHPKNKKPKQR